MLGLSGYAIFFLQVTSLNLKLKYPPKDCVSKGTGFMFTEYNGNNLEEIMPKIKKDAIEEVEKAWEHKSREIAESHPGYL